MNYTIKLFLVLISLSFGGCYKTKIEKQVTFNMDASEKLTLTSQCEEMMSYGDINHLLAEIKNETKIILALLEDGDMLKNKTLIADLADNIDKNSTAVIALSKAEWIVPRWDFQAEWIVDKNDFNDVLGAHIKKAFLIRDVHMQKIFLHGEERSDLIKNITLTEKHNKVIISYKNRGSSLELCQLNKTLMILMKVSFRNITNTNYRFFNLTLNN